MSPPQTTRGPDATSDDRSASNLTANDVRFSKQDSRNTRAVLAGQLLRVILQATYFTFLTRSIGAAGYGTWGATLAATAIVAPFASWGLGLVMIREISRDGLAFSASWRKCLIGTLSSGLTLSILTAVAANLIVPNAPLPSILLLTLADLVFTRLTDCAGYVFQAFGNLRRATLISLLPSIIRAVIAPLIYFSALSASLTMWAVLYFTTALLGLTFGYTMVHSNYGPPARRAKITWADRRDGTLFAIGSMSATVYNDVDKLMLARLTTLDATGLYVAAYRFVDMAFTPARSMLNATFAPFFISGRAGIHGALRFARSFQLKTSLMGALGSVGLLVFSPFVGLVLGDTFQNAGLALVLLSPLPFLKSIHTVLSDVLTGSGHQAARTRIQVLVAIINAGANLILLPKYSWKGAVWTSLGSDILLLTLLGVVVYRLGRSKLTQAAPAQIPSRMDKF